MMSLPGKYGDGKLAPLLPEKGPAVIGGDYAGQGGSFHGAVFNLSTSIIGAGIMSIPATVKVLGMVPAFTLIFFMAVLSDVSIEFLMRFTDSGTSTSYSGVMLESFGRVGSSLLQLCVSLTTMGCLVVYLIIICDVLCGSSNGDEGFGLLQEWFGIRWWNSRGWTMFFTAVFILLPLVSFRRVDSLRFSSAVSVFLALLFLVTIAAMAIIASFSGHVQSPILFPQINGDTSIFKLFAAVPVLVTAFTCHFNVHHIKVELKNPGEMKAVSRSSLLLCAFIYASTGFFGYILFGENIMADVLINFNAINDSSRLGVILMKDVVRWSYALHLMLVFPLLFFPLRISLDTLLFSDNIIEKPLQLASDTKRFAVETVCLLACLCFAAISIPSIWTVFQFLGSTTAVCIAFVFPGAIVLRDVNKISSKKDRILGAVVIVVAVMSSLVTIVSNAIDFTN